MTDRIQARDGMRALWAALALGLALWASPAPATTFKIATVAPDGTSWMKKMRAGAEEIAQRTDGRVEFRFYGGGVMGNDDSVLRQIRFGRLQGGAFTGGGATTINPDVAVYSLPLLFNGYEEVDFVRERVDPMLRDGLEERGFVSFGFAGGGFAMLMSKEPLRRLADLKGRKVWVPEGDKVIYRSMQALGLSPVTLPLTDVLTGLQTGLIDIVGTSALGAIAFQWHSELRYVADAPLVYLIGTMIVDRRSFERLSEADQAVVREVYGAIYAEFERENRADDVAARRALAEQGLEFLEPEETVRDWRRELGDLYHELVEEDVISEDVYRAVEERLETFRASRREAGQGDVDGDGDG